jgi:Mrp family chromosome partitioning ATPase/uncharacterized protein involved in exopolysaccharide biosynthesis
MNQDILLYNANQQTPLARPAPADDPFGLGGGGNASHKPTGLKKIHQCLRGRYPWAIGLGLAIGVVGGVCGFLFSHPVYRSKGLIQIKSVVQNANSASDQPFYGYHSFVKTQLQVIPSNEIVRNALKKDDWRKTSRPNGEDAIPSFQNDLDVENLIDSELIEITYDDPDPRVAQAAIKSVCKAYKEYYDAQDPLGIRVKADLLDKKQTGLVTDYNDKSRQLDQLSQPYATDNPQSYLERQQDLWTKMQSDLFEAEMDLQAAQPTGALKSLGADGASQSATAAGTTRPTQLTEDQIDAAGDKHMHVLLDQRQRLAATLEDYQARGYGDNHPRVQYVHEMIDRNEKAIRDYVDALSGTVHAPANRGGGIASNPLAPGQGYTAADIERLTSRRDRLKKAVDDKWTEIQKIGENVRQLTRVKDQMADAKAQLDQVNRLRETLQGQQDLNTTPMLIISDGDLPTAPYSDKRKQLGALAFLGGSLLPAAVLVLIGLLDGRYRFSDEANDQISGVPLLGILPNLPDLLTDPEQAATAAHCVHQIRTLLQINGHTADRRTFCITSGSSGDGKTSLALALGLSFAASGSRTLLIDFDLIGAGLTARLGVKSATGVLEAMSSRHLGEFVKGTDVADLSILPVGEAMGSYTGTVSPAAVRRLVTEARKQYDTILIDTGPLLGSIEASPVAVAADGVILCVARGQQRQLVERALQHLQVIGARLAGVVFNRAQAYDFDRSVSRSMLQSTPAQGNGNGTPNGRTRESGNGRTIGPVAKAVASSVRTGPGEAAN